MQRLRTIAIILLMFLFVSCAKQAPISIEPPKQAEEPIKVITPQPECRTYSDCVPATCCHPNDCVPKAQQPDCQDTVCTDECRQVTMDCGKGKCECIDHECTAVIYG